MAGANWPTNDRTNQYLDNNDNVSELGLGDPEVFTIPSLSDFPATKSDASIVSKVEGEDEKATKEAKHGGTLVALRQGIKTMPDSGYIHTYLFQGDWYKSIRSIFLVSDRPTIHRLAYRSPVSVFIERSRHLASFPNVIHPYSSFRWYWDILMTLFLMVTLITDPLRMTFFGESLMEGSSFHVQIGILITVMFLIDIVLNFRTGLVDTSTQLVNLDTEIIARSYACGWFLVDILSSVPFDLIFILYTRSSGGSFEGESTYVQVVRILELFKIFRLSRAVRYISRLLLAYKVQGMYVRFIDHLLTVSYLTHWLACLHWLIPDMVNEDRLPKKNGSWITRRELWNKTFPEKYLNCYFRSLSHQVAMSLDTHPTEPEEILVSILNVLCGVGLLACFIGHVSSILLSDGVPERKYVETINQVQEYLRFKQVPKELQKRIMLFYEIRFQRNFFREEQILSSVSEVLRKEILMHNCRNLVEQVPIFQGLSSPVIYAIVEKLQFQVYLPLDMVVTIHSVGETMYFIENGMVSILAENGRVIGHLKDGDFFGELALISSEKRVASVVATSHVNAYLLHRADFNQAMHGYPEILERILKISYGRINKINKIADIIRGNDDNAKKEIQKELEALAKGKRKKTNNDSGSSSSSSATTIT